MKIKVGHTYHIIDGMFKGDQIEVTKERIGNKYFGKVFLEGSDLYQELTIDADHIGEEV